MCCCLACGVIMSVSSSSSSGSCSSRAPTPSTALAGNRSKFLGVLPHFCYRSGLSKRRRNTLRTCRNPCVRMRPRWDLRISCASSIRTTTSRGCTARVCSSSYGRCGMRSILDTSPSSCSTPRVFPQWILMAPLTPTSWPTSSLLLPVNPPTKALRWRPRRASRTASMRMKGRSGCGFSIKRHLRWRRMRRRRRSAPSRCSPPGSRRATAGSRRGRRWISWWRAKAAGLRFARHIGSR
mmetsp:Transcript_34911/g.79197  ORF Transcript_34911/g.79197 Transcript_34911/m.79197 type:complete len:238 (-) Transcript_34911:560-1273(-)